jgi:hypothetical protein
MKLDKKTIGSIIITIIFIAIMIFIIGNNNKKNNLQLTTDSIPPSSQEVDKTWERYPIDITVGDVSTYLDIATPLVKEILVKSFKEKGDILDYKINEIKYVVANIYSDEDYRNGYLPEIPANSKEDIFPSERYTGDAFIVTVNFSVKARLAPDGHTDWIAGNGEQGSDGWILNKFMYVMIDKVSGKYQAEFLGTGL